MPRNDMLEITTLGGLTVSRGGAPVTGFQSDKGRALLVYLAVESERPHRRESLAGLLWDELSQSRALANVRVVLHSLRQRLGAYVEATRSTAALAIDFPHPVMLH